MQRYEQYRLTIKSEEGRPHEFFFRNPPSREDFLELAKMVPWMATWDETLIPAIRDKSTNWPYLTFGQKASHSAVEVDGEIYRITVDRWDLYQNGYYVQDYLSHEDASRLTCRLKDREGAFLSLRYNDLAITNISVEENVAIQDAARLWLERKGFRKPKKK